MGLLLLSHLPYTSIVELCPGLGAKVEVIVRFLLSMLLSCLLMLFRVPITFVLISRVYSVIILEMQFLLTWFFSVTEVEQGGENI